MYYDFIPYPVSAGNNTYSAKLSDRMRSSNAAIPGIHMQFKPPTDRNLTSDNTLERNVSHFILFDVKEKELDAPSTFISVFINIFCITIMIV